MRLWPWPRERRLNPPAQDPRPTRVALARLNDMRQELIEQAAVIRRIIAEESREADSGT